MPTDQWIMSRRTALALNAGILLAYGAIAIFTRPWAAFAGCLVLGTAIRMATYSWTTIRAWRRNELALSVGLLGPLLLPPIIAGLIYTTLFVGLWFLGDYWKIIGVLVCGAVAYLSLLPVPPKNPPGSD